MSEHTAESIRLKANEALLSSKGFMLFTVDQFGVLNFAGDTTFLNSAEVWGIDAYRKNMLIDEDYKDEPG